jgi:hypothetical protein
MPVLHTTGTYDVALELQGPSAGSTVSLLTYGAVPLNTAGALTPTAGQAAQIALVASLRFSTFWAAYGISSWIFRGATVSEYGSFGGAPVGVVTTAHTAAAQAGATVTGALPPGICEKVKKVTPSNRLNGRNVSGAWFLPGVSEPAVDNAGVLNTTDRVATEGNLTTFLNGIKATPATQPGAHAMVVYFKPDKLATVYSNAPVTGMTINPKVTYLRKRAF